MGGGSGEVRLVLLSQSGDSAIAIDTQNDGIYTFAGAQLSGLTAGDYGIVLINETVKYINAPGYDSRSYLRGRVMNTTLVHLQ
jgi:hypothetical protein